VGCVIARRTSVSPTGHGGNVDCRGGSSIILYPEYFEARSGKVVIKPLLTIYAWEELY